MIKNDDSGVEMIAAANVSSKTTSMNRLLTALSHREPDRIPIDFGGTDTSTIMVGPYLEFAKKFGKLEKKTIKYSCADSVGTFSKQPCS